MRIVIDERTETVSIQVSPSEYPVDERKAWTMIQEYLDQGPGLWLPNMVRAVYSLAGIAAIEGWTLSHDIVPETITKTRGSTTDIVHVKP
jgi:hypothetical protein